MTVLNQDDYGYQMRFYNPYNSALSGISLSLNAAGVSKTEETNMLGVSAGDLASGNSATVSFKAMEIKSVRALLTSPKGTRLGIHPDTTVFLAPGQTGWMYVNAENSSGRIAYASSGTIHISASSPSIKFSSDRTVWSNTIDVDMTSGRSKVFVQGSVSGSYTITVSDQSNRLAQAEKKVIILGADHINFVTADTVIAALNSECPLSVELRDQRNMLFSNTDSMQVRLTSSHGTMYFKNSKGAWQKELVASISGGQISTCLQGCRKNAEWRT